MTVTTVLMAAGAIVSVFPFLWMISTSFKVEIDVLEFPIRLIPKTWNFNNYVTVFTKSSFPLYYWNSIKVTFWTVLGSLFFSATAAYGFAKLRFKGREVLFLVYLATMMVPTQAIMLPKYVMFRMWNLSDTHWALILPGLFSAFSVFFLRQNFMTIPDAYLEAAKIDGAGYLWTFANIMLPLGKGALITLTLLNFTWSWNDYLNPLIFLSSNERLTITVGLQRFQETYSTNYALIMAGASTALVPILILFLCAQKYFVESFAAAGVKG